MFATVANLTRSLNTVGKSLSRPVSWNFDDIYFKISGRGFGLNDQKESGIGAAELLGSNRCDTYRAQTIESDYAKLALGRRSPICGAWRRIIGRRRSRTWRPELDTYVVFGKESVF
jgi:hypothetical protein